MHGLVCIKTVCLAVVSTVFTSEATPATCEYIKIVRRGWVYDEIDGHGSVDDTIVYTGR